MAEAERNRSRSTNFWILPVEVFGSTPKITCVGTLKRAISARQCSLISASVAAGALPLRPGQVAIVLGSNRSYYFLTTA